MRVLWWSDAHVSDVPPVMRTEGYTEDIFLKIEEIAELCVSEKVDYSLFGGDFFNSKIASRVSHNLVNRSLRTLDKFPCPIIWIVGSHDVPYGRLDLLYKRPIGTLLRHPKVKYITDTLELSDKDINVRIFPVSDAYNNTTEEVVNALTAMKHARPLSWATGTGSYDIAMLHQPVVKDGSYPYPVIQSADLVGLSDMLLYGHMHNYVGEWELALDGHKTTFVNVGAISRGSLDEKTLSRVPMTLLFDVSKTESGSFRMTYKETPLKSAKPAEQVFRLAEKQESVDREADIEALLTSVKETGFAAFSSQAAVDRIKSLSYGEDESTADTTALMHFETVKTVAVEILEELGG